MTKTKISTKTEVGKCWYICCKWVKIFYPFKDVPKKHLMKKYLSTINCGRVMFRANTRLYLIVSWFIGNKNSNGRMSRYISRLPAYYWPTNKPGRLLDKLNDVTSPVRKQQNHWGDYCTIIDFIAFIYFYIVLLSLYLTYDFNLYKHCMGMF